MTVLLTMPQLSMSMTEGDLSEWLVPDGSSVIEGQPIYTVESDKSTLEVEAPAAGTLKQIGTPGQCYKVGEKIGEIT